MKKLFAFLGIIIWTWCLDAQTVHDSKSLILSQDSFRLEQTDALTNVNIDPIGKDPSNRRCARIKMGINRMTPEEISKVQVKVVGGNVVLTKRVPMRDRGGLELEMTARNATFYLYHPVLGESNTVTVPLEADKVYLIDAWAEQSLPMTVFCARGGAEVYLDGIYRGVIDNVDHTLTITGVMSGKHHLKVASGSDVTEQDIELTSDKVFFNVELKSTAHLQQFLVFNVEPKNALVEVDGETWVVNDGIAQKLVKFGTYSYTVVAKDYHKTTGQVTVNSTAAPKEVNVALKPAFGWVNVTGRSSSGAVVYVDNEYVGKAPIRSGRLSSGVHSVKIIKDLHKEYGTSVTVTDGNVVELNPTLESNYATLNLKTPDVAAQIRINNEVKGTGSWIGHLSPGTYRIEVAKDRHVSSFETIEVKAGDALTLNLPAPTPISGTLAITSLPSGASVYIDGTLVGKTPYYMPDALVGSHTVAVSKAGYSDWHGTIVIEEGKHTEEVVTLKQGTSFKLEPEKHARTATKSNTKYKRASLFRNNDTGYLGGFGMEIGWDMSAVNYFKLTTSQGYQFDKSFYLGAYAGYTLDFYEKLTGDMMLPIFGIDARMLFGYSRVGYSYLGVRLYYPFIMDVYYGYSFGVFGLLVSVNQYSLNVGYMMVL